MSLYLKIINTQGFGDELVCFVTDQALNHDVNSVTLSQLTQVWLRTHGRTPKSSNCSPSSQSQQLWRHRYLTKNISLILFYSSSKKFLNMSNAMRRRITLRVLEYMLETRQNFRAFGADYLARKLGNLLSVYSIIKEMLPMIMFPTYLEPGPHWLHSAYYEWSSWFIDECKNK